MDGILCAVLCICIICFLVCLFPIRSQHVSHHPTSAKQSRIKKSTPNHRHASYKKEEVQEPVPSNTSDGKKTKTTPPLTNSFTFVKTSEPSIDTENIYSHESLQEKLSTETMARFAENRNYTKSLDKFMRYQERDFLDTVKVGDPNVRPVGGSFGCKIPNGSY